MASINYMAGRKKYQRPQGVLFADNAGRIERVGQGTDEEAIYYLPNGYEVGAVYPEGADESEIDQFIILSDDSRQPINFTTTRIERRERMINGRMRSYHIADKLILNLSWDMLPSRSFSTIPNFNTLGKPGSTVPGDADGQDGIEQGETVPLGLYGSPLNKDNQFTTDGGAGGNEILDWYSNHPGSFWVYLSYDKYPSFGKDEIGYKQLPRYSEVIEVFFADFQYSVVKRGGSNYDFWNISLTLEEV